MMKCNEECILGSRGRQLEGGKCDFILAVRLSPSYSSIWLSIRKLKIVSNFCGLLRMSNVSTKIKLQYQVFEKKHMISRRVTPGLFILIGLISIVTFSQTLL